MGGPVHPRACGEYEAAYVVHYDNGGSPPRLRGILEFVAQVFEPRRFTPAPAGNTIRNECRA